MTTMKRVRALFIPAAILTAAGIALDFGHQVGAILLGFIAGWVGGYLFMAARWAWFDAQRTGRL